MARHRYSVSFRPLTAQAKDFMLWLTGIDYRGVDLNDPEVWCCCTVSRRYQPVIVIVFEFKAPHDAHLTLAVTDPHGLSRHLITSLYRGIFQRAARVTALIDPDNRDAVQQVWRMGFKPEGYLRRGYDGERDAAVWGLLPEDCPYLQGRPFRYRVVQATHGLAERMQ